MMPTISKRVRINCYECGAVRYYEYESSYPNHLIIQDLRHQKGWVVGQRCICPGCRGSRE